MATNGPDEDPAVEDQRLSSFDERLAQVRNAEKARTTLPVGDLGMTGKGSAQGNRVLSTLIGFPLGGALIGWLIDRALASTPWVMLALLFLGILAAGREIWKISQERPE